MSRRAFTLVEMLVVVGMLGVLMGAMGVAIVRARAAALSAKAMQEAKEITNAIQAYEHYAPGHTLDTVASGGWADCVEGAMGMILGKVSGDNGKKVPVLFEGALTGGAIVDPWGRPYQYRIEKTSNIPTPDTGNYMTAPSLPNMNRLTFKERGVVPRKERGL